MASGSASRLQYVVADVDLDHYRLCTAGVKPALEPLARACGQLRCTVRKQKKKRSDAGMGPIRRAGIAAWHTVRRHKRGYAVCWLRPVQVIKPGTVRVRFEDRQHRLLALRLDVPVVTGAVRPTRDWLPRQHRGCGELGRGLGRPCAYGLLALASASHAVLILRAVGEARRALHAVAGAGTA